MTSRLQSRAVIRTRAAVAAAATTEVETAEEETAEEETAATAALLTGLEVEMAKAVVAAAALSDQL